MPATDTSPELRERVAALESEIAAVGEDAQAAWHRYYSLRNRKLVRAVLALAGARDRVRRVVGERLPGRSGGVAAVACALPGADPPPTLRADPAPSPSPAAPADAVAHPWPLGHFYSPVPDTVALAREPERSRVWSPHPSELAGIDWRAEEQIALVRDSLATIEPVRFPAGPTGDPADYHTGNDMWSELDAWAQQAMLRHLRPARLIEVGCGWSSLVAARVNRECLDGRMDVTCIEPFVPDFLRDGVEGITRVVGERVQDVPVERFLELGAGDVLFIDSSHVVKTGSDARHLYHEVLPRLARGVVVHVHDVFLPWDYPEEWVLTGRGWNEQYVLQSFLAFNAAFEVMLGSHGSPARTPSCSRRSASRPSARTR
jgi:hypothetical protein